MTSQLGRDVRWDSLLSCMYSADCVQQFVQHVSLKHVGSRTSFEGSHHLDVARISRQDDDSRVGKLTANSLDRCNSVQSRHLYIHQRYVWLMKSERLNGFLPIRGFGNQFQIRFSVY